MSSRPPTAGKLPLTELGEMKQRGDPIVMVTAYDYPSGRLVDAAGVDLVLFVDTAAMVVMGYDATVPATLEEMLLLTRWVSRGASRPLVVGDLPFGSYEVSDAQAVETSVRMLKEGGADLVKRDRAGRGDLLHEVLVPLAFHLDVGAGAEFDRLDQVVVDVGVDAGLAESVESGAGRAAGRADRARRRL